jgi:hypothetical protein
MNLNTIPLWHMELCWNNAWIQEWWLKRWNDPVHGTMSNIRVGDFFTLGRCNQVGIVTRKTIICGPNPGPELQYDIGGDIGGHWYRPRHEEFENGPTGGGEQYFLFIPSATQLCELAGITGRATWFAWAERLLIYYKENPCRSTHRAKNKPAYTKPNLDTLKEFGWTEPADG